MRLGSTYPCFALCVAVPFMMTACDREPAPRSANTSSSDAQLSSKATLTAQQVFDEGVRLGKNGQYEAAVEAYSTAIELDPTHCDAHTFRGLTYLELGNFSAAISDLDAFVNLDPSAASYLTRANVYARNGVIDKAISDYDKCIELAPNDATAYHNRGTAYGENREYSIALRDMTKAIRLEPENPRFVFDRAVLKAKQGNLDDAMVDAEEALRLAGGSPDLRPGEARITDELTFNCMHLIADLESTGAKRTQ